MIGSAPLWTALKLAAAVAGWETRADYTIGSVACRSWLSENLRVKGGDMRDAKGLVRVVLAGLALISSAVRIAVAQEKGGGDVTGPSGAALTK